MERFLKTYIWLLFPFLFVSSLKSSQSPVKIMSHQITIKHPGEETPVNTILEEIKTSEGLTVEYTMDVYSVICLKGVCKVILVKLFWNAVGEYKKYELAKGKTLEKYEADLFEPKDYVKLQNILSDNNSPFKEVYYDEILDVPVEHGNEDVDAVSGATAIQLDEKDTVPGAALTCFTLWHWANGEVVSKIKAFTGASSSKDQLKDFILHENTAYFEIAIVELQKRKLYSKDFVDSVIQKILLDNTLLRTGNIYFNELPLDFYLYATERFFLEGGKEHKISIIQWLRETSMQIPHSFLDKLSSEMPRLDSYQEISLILDLLETKNKNSQMVLENTIPLLEADFLMARRVYWFLKNQKLNAEQLKTLELFYQKNKNRL